MKIFRHSQKSKKQVIALALTGLVWIGGNTMAMDVNVDSATKSMPGKVESTKISVPLKTPVINQISDVVYEQVPMRGYPNVAMKMDILQPKSEKKLPAIVYVTGGGFINANKDNGIQLRMHLAEAGYVVASIQYRVAPTARFPEPLEDVKSSIRYLKAHADQFGIDPERIGIIGGSAGGYLAAMAATTSGTTTFDKGDNLQAGSDVKAAVDLYGLSDLARIGDDYSDAVKEAHQSAGATEALWVTDLPYSVGKTAASWPIRKGPKKPIPLPTFPGPVHLCCSCTAQTIPSFLPAKPTCSFRHSKGITSHPNDTWLKAQLTAAFTGTRKKCSRSLQTSLTLT